MIGMFWICVHLILVGILHVGDAIIYGTVAPEGRFQYMAFVENHLFGCGGAVLDQYHILTAAYCVNGSTASDIIVVAGTASRGTQWQVVREVKKIYVHPNYGEGCSRLSLDYYVQCYRRSTIPYLRNSRSKNDIAVLTLTEPLPLGGNITSVNLPSTDYLPYGHLLLYSAWAEPDPETNYRLRFVYLKIMSRRWYISYRKKEFYARYNHGNSHASIGDIGNPLVKRKIVYGITFDAVPLPGGRIIFTKVFSHLPFIQEAMRDVDDFGNC